MKKEAQELADSLNAKLEAKNRKGQFEVTVLAPKGFEWDGGIHEIVSAGYDWRECYKSAIRIMKLGLTKCEANCEGREED